MLAHDIEPLCTLYHWDLPAALDDRGGWLNRDSAEWFADYGRVMFDRLDGRVKKWVTLNEPWVITDGGYLHGALAPGHRNMFEAPIASRNLMRAHGAAVKAYREVGKHEIGLVVNLEPKYPASDSAEDQAATARADAYMNRQYLDPAIHGTCPDELADIFGEAWTDWSAEDLALAKQKIDFVGINYYTRNVTSADDSWPLSADMVKQPHATYTTTGWEVFPQGLTDVLLWVKEQYGDPAIYITENGAAFFDPAGRRARPGRGSACACPICAITSPRSARRSSRAPMCAATCCGRCSTISNGRSAIRSGSASSTSISPRRSARSRIRPNSTAR